MVKPRFIEKIESFGQSPDQTFGKIILNPSICSQSTVDKVKKMMFNVVDKKWGTAHNIKDKDLSLAGKTGTCQVDYNKKDKEVQYASTFVGYFPAEEPKYSCIVVIHKPDKKLGYYGSTVAAPVFKKIENRPKTIHTQCLTQLKIHIQSKGMTNPSTVLKDKQYQYLNHLRVMNRILVPNLSLKGLTHYQIEILKFICFIEFCENL